MATDVPFYNNIAPIRQVSELDFDNLGLTNKSSSSPRGVSTGRSFNQGNHRNSIITQEGITIIVSKGNICDQMVDGIVSSVGGDFDLSKGAVAKSILQKAGPNIQKELHANRPSNVHYGDVVITKGYNLNAKWVFHGSLKGYGSGQDDSEQILRDFIKKILNEAAKKNLRSVAFPAIGAGALSFPADLVASCLFETVDNFSSKNSNPSISEVRCVIYDKDVQTFSAFERKISQVVQSGGASSNSDDDEYESASPQTLIDNLKIRDAKNKQVVAEQGIKVPSTWCPPDPLDPYHRVKLSSSDAEYQTVVKNVRASCLSTMSKIIKIERIENHMLFNQYMITHNHLAQVNGPSVKTERRLWHGTCKDALDNIYAGGFNRGYCGKNATFYGKGVYFARDFSYSAQPTYSPADSSGNRYIFQARVLTGQFAVGNPDIIEPPVRAGKLRYDSVTNNIDDPAIFVVFKDTHAYPEYLVTFN